MVWVPVTRDPPAGDPVWRRFGRLFEKPCNDPRTIECALAKCQYADACQAKVS